MLRLFLHMQRAFWSTLLARLMRTSPRQDWPFILDVATKLLLIDGQYLVTLPPPELRRQYDLRAQKTAVMKRVTVTLRDVGNVRCAEVLPKERDGDRTVLYLHGGAYIFGSYKTHADTLARVAEGCRARVVAPEYRQAPEHPYPAQLEDALAVYRALLEEVPPSRIVVAGESAGGNLTAALLIALRDAHEPLPAGGVLMSAWLDMESDRPSVRENAKYDWGDAALLRGWATQFRGSVPATDPRVSPIRAELSGLPPLYVLVSAHELLHDENRELAEKVRAAGGRAELDVVPRHAHTPIFFAEWSKPAADAVGRMAAWVRSLTA